MNSVDHHWTITTGPAPVIRALQPADGSTGIAVDTPISVSFSTAMDAAATEAAITLNPPVPGTRVVRNLRDPSRFVVLPGATLEAGVTYQLDVGVAATDIDHQPLVTGAVSTFTTAGMSPGPHVVVLAAVPGEGATTVLISPLAPAAGGRADRDRGGARCPALPAPDGVRNSGLPGAALHVRCGGAFARR